MMGWVFNIQRFSLHDGPGIRTTVFLMGCNLNCLWCHNPEGKSDRIQLQYDNTKCIGCSACARVCSQMVHTVTKEGHWVDFARCRKCGACIEICPAEALCFSGRKYTPEELTQQVIKDRSFFRDTGGLTFSGGEPLLQADFVAETAMRCREQGVPTVTVDTAGLLDRSAFEKVLPYVDHFLFDVKAASEEVHLAGTGASNRPILENLRWLDTQGKNIYIRVPVVPGFNDDCEEIRKIGDIVHGLKSVREFCLLPYHTFGREKYITIGAAVPPVFPVPEEETMDRLRHIARCF